MSSYAQFFLPREVRWSWQALGCHSDDLELFLLERCAPIQATGCWEWTGKRSGAGYGVFNNPLRTGRWYYAHRASQQLWNGPLTTARPWALHGCDNPPCINPEHLRAGTPKENMEDRDRRGRGFWQQPGYMGAPSNISDEKLAELFAMRVAGASHSQIERALGINQGTVSLILSGKSHARRVARLFATEAA